MNLCKNIDIFFFDAHLTPCAVRKPPVSLNKPFFCGPKLGYQKRFLFFLTEKKPNDSISKV